MTSTQRPAFLEGMSRAAQTVCIVTTDGPGGRGGVTVSTLTSVSADTPAPTLLICVHHTASAAPLILTNGRFCVNILSADQSAIADAFAGRRKDLIDRFTVADWSPMTSGAWRLTQALVAFDCTLAHHSRVGTHDILMAEVQDVHLGSLVPPLTYAKPRLWPAHPAHPLTQDPPWPTPATASSTPATHTLNKSWITIWLRPLWRAAR